MESSLKPIGLLGAGAWGGALAKHLTRQQHTVHVWHKEEKVLDPLSDPHIHYSRQASHLDSCDVILCVVPAQYVRPVMIELKEVLQGKTLIICSKGIENQSHKLMSEIVAECISDIRISVLSGPNFAKEMRLGLPAGFCLAASTIKQAKMLIPLMTSSVCFGVPSTDLVGVQLGGSLKNIIAIGCGMTIGAELGDNAKAALITRGLEEMKQIGVAMGAEAATFYGLSGIGDLVLTCNGPLSRNLNFGINLGKGMTADEALALQTQTTEGYYTAQSAVALANRHQIETPVIQGIHRLLQGEITLEQTFKDMFKK